MMKYLSSFCFSLILMLGLILASISNAYAMENPLKAINTPEGKIEFSISNSGVANISSSVKTNFGASTNMTVYLQNTTQAKPSG